MAWPWQFFPGGGYYPMGYPEFVVPTDRNEAIQLARTLVSRADIPMDFGQKLHFYKRALTICDNHDFNTLAADIHGKIAGIYLRKAEYPHAGFEAENCVRFNPDNPEGYYLRAESLVRSQSLLSSVRTGTRNPMYSVQAIGDYITFYRKSSPNNRDMTCLCKAVVLAVNSGNTSMLDLVHLVINKKDCTDLVVNLINLNESRCKHLDYLVRTTPTIKGSGYALQCGCELSNIKCSNLLKKSDMTVTTLEAFFKLGVRVRRSDVQDAIKCVNSSATDVFKLVMSSCKDRIDIGELTSLCSIALSPRSIKADIAAHLVSLGATPQCNDIVSTLDSFNPNEQLMSYLLSTKDGSTTFIKKAFKNPAYVDTANRYLDGAFGSVNVELIDLAELLPFVQSNTELFQKLLSVEVNPNGIPDGNKPLDVVLKMPKTSTAHKADFICMLTEAGASLECASYPKTIGTTIIHLATSMALETENPTILEVVCSHYPFPEDGKVTDKDNKTPLHHIMEPKFSQCAEKICQILCEHVNGHVVDNSGKKAHDVRPKRQDKRHKILHAAAEKFPSSAPKGKKNQKKKARKSTKKKDEVDNSTTVNQPQEDELFSNPENVQSNQKTKQQSSLDLKNENPVLQLVNEILDSLSTKPDSYFKSPPDYKRQSSSQKSSNQPEGRQEQPQSSNPQTQAQQQHVQNNSSHSKSDQAHPDSDEEGLEVVDGSTFDGLAWEVEFPEKVLKFFKDPKVPNHVRENAIKKIQRLASGIPIHNEKMCKMVHHELYEARVTKAVRIIYEIAIQFSPRSTEKQQHVGHVYSEVIRIWDIVLDHDNLSRSIKLAVERIKKSHERGSQATTTIPLKFAQVSKGDKSTRGAEELRFPHVYIDNTLDHNAAAEVATPVFSPAGSAKEDEYNVVTFYTFDSSFVKSMLEGESARRDFPFKEWPKEHDIISMKQGSCSILLLGRSGTGKTTCCLYRLWNHFQSYWINANHAGPLIPRNPLILYHDQSEAQDAESDEEMDIVNDDSTSSCTALVPAQEELPLCLEDATDNEETEKTLDHFHQVFVTKNYVLCAQMQKRFYDLAAGSDIAEAHMPFEEAKIPSTISEIDHLAYPLFLTARQFFILLDNSLADGKNFFPRDGEGELKVKIVSSDYDHENPDTLLDLEFESDIEESDESDVEESTPSQPVKTKQKLTEWKEVTASYFAENIWPSIQHICQDKKTDPLLVWMEIKSFIKGSSKAVQSMLGYLSEDEYEEIGKKMASNFAGNRKEVYKIFEKYQHMIKHTTGEHLFDEGDLVHNICSRLNDLQDLPWSIHSFYIDEVQDFTQAELSILLRCCRDPNDLFLTGDTAQSIMRGISFRFSDLRSLFHKAQKQAKKVKKAVEISVPKVHELTINFRSHSGVLQLAASIIDLLKKFFPSSFDRLPGDEGMFPGPIPKVLDSCNVSDLALVLRSNKRESTTIEFGAHQVIIVQSEDAKKSLPDVLQAGIVLTVFEAKGLEFDDVLLYDFFKDSKISKEWRVVGSYLESKPELKTNTKPGFTTEPRPLNFDEQHHKSLNAELKYLYTAITRAKCNLWIYDSDETRRLPVFDYWHKRGLIKLIRMTDISPEDQSLLFAATSSKEEWKAQGDYFKKKRLWEPAMKCYKNAEDVHLEREAEAYFLVQQAKACSQKLQEMRELYLKAALAFLKCDESKHDQKCLVYAAMCLRKAKKHREAGKLYARLERHKEALREFKKSKNITACAQLKEMARDYNGAISMLVDSRCMIEALERAQRYEQQGIKLKSELSTEHLAETFARQLVKEGKHKRLLKVVDYISNVTTKVYYLRAVGKHDEACEILLQNGQHDEVFRLYYASGEYAKGLKLAEEKRAEKWMGTFVFCKAAVQLVTHGRIDDPAVDSMLKQFKGGNDINKKAKACLLLGKSARDDSLCKVALSIYRSLNPAGYVEAFNEIVQINGSKDVKMASEDAVRLTIEAYTKACDIVDAVKHFSNNEKAKSDKRSLLVSQIEDFYGLQKQVGTGGQEEYHFPADENQHLWMKFYLPQANHDSQGMLILECYSVLLKVSEHMGQYLNLWKTNDHLQVCESVKHRMQQYHFHKEMQRGGYLQESYFGRYSARPLHEYLRLCYTMLELNGFGGKFNAFPKSTLTEILTSFFSPQATVFLDVTLGHMQSVSKSAMGELMLNLAASVMNKKDNEFSMDEWLNVWRIHSIMGKGTAELEKNLRARVNKNPNPVPYSFCFDREHNKYDHVFDLWLKSCHLIRSENRVMTSTKITLHFVLRTFARERRIRSTLSVMSLVNILTVHTSALLSLSILCSHHLKQSQSMRAFIPTSCHRVLQIFDNLNRQINKPHARVFDACIADVTVQKASPRIQALLRVKHDITNLLWEILDMLVGRYMRWFNPLKHAVDTEICLQRGEARHCLVLALVLFNNLAQTHDPIDDLYPYQQSILYALQKLAQYQEKYSNALNIFATSVNTGGAYLALDQLLKSADQRDVLLQLVVDHRQHPWKIGLRSFSIQNIPQRPWKVILQASSMVLPVQVVQMQSQTVAKPPQSVWNQPGAVTLPLNPVPVTHNWDTQMTATPSHPASAHLPQGLNTVGQSFSQNVSQFVDDPAVTVLSPSLTTDRTLQVSRTIGLEEEDTAEDIEPSVMDDDVREVMQPAPEPAFESQVSLDQYKHSDESQQLESMTDRSVCRICAVPLKSDDYTEDVVPSEVEGEEPDHEGGSNEQQENVEEKSSKDVVVVESYTKHCNSETHKQNCKLYELFSSIHHDTYEPVKAKLTEVLQECQYFVAQNVSPEVSHIITAINEEIAHNEKELLETKYSATWRIGFSSVQNDMYGRMDSLIDKAGHELKKERLRVKQDEEEALKRKEMADQEAEEQNEDEEEEVEIEDAEKKDWRKEKRERKKRRYLRGRKT